jgi:hypothetical protein
MLPTIEELAKGYTHVLAHYDLKLVEMRKTAINTIAELRVRGHSFLERKHDMDKIKWIDTQRVKIKRCKMPTVGKWVDAFPIGEWNTNGLSKEENIYEFIKKRFELGYLNIEEPTKEH